MPKEYFIRFGFDGVPYEQWMRTPMLSEDRVNANIEFLRQAKLGYAVLRMVKGDVVRVAGFVKVGAQHAK